MGMDPTDHNTPLDRNSQLADHEMLVLARYLSGECTDEEGARIRSWIESDPARQALARQGSRIWIEASRPVLTWNTDRIWQELQDKRSVVRSGPLHHTRSIFGIQPGRFYLGAIALGMCAIITLGVLSFHGSTTAPQQMVEQGVEGDGRVFATRRGQRSVIKLPDGAEITLAADSRIRVPQNYGISNRNLYLEGTAQFSVQHDAKKPFVVHTRFGEVRDLATVFVVSAYDSDTVQRVIVKEGRVASVASRGDRAQVILNPGDMGLISYNGTSAVQHDADISAHTAWVSGELRFDNTPLGEVVMELERWYDVTLRIDDSQLARTPITVSLGKGTIDDALSVIEKILNIKSQRHKSHIRLVKESLNEI